MNTGETCGFGLYAFQRIKNKSTLPKVPEKKAALKNAAFFDWVNNPLNNDLKAEVVFGIPECATKTKRTVLAVQMARTTRRTGIDVGIDIEDVLSTNGYR